MCCLSPFFYVVETIICLVKYSIVVDVAEKNDYYVNYCERSWCYYVLIVKKKQILVSLFSAWLPMLLSFFLSLQYFTIIYLYE